MIEGTETATVGLDLSKSQGGQWGQFGTPFHLISAPQYLHRLCCDSSWLDQVGKKLSVKADLVIYSYIVTVSECGYNVKQYRGFQLLCD